MMASPQLDGELTRTAPTRVFGRFEVLRALGQGGTAAVFEAHDHEADRRVALKLLHEDLTRSAAQRQAFLAEAQFMQLVQHPGVVHVLDYGEHDRSGSPAQAWVAMEVAGGQSLVRQVRERGPLTVPDALLLVEELLDAIDGVHRAGIVHRDITPANVMLQTLPGGAYDAGSVQLLDFGLAGLPGSPATAASAEPDAARAGSIASNLIWGSALYLSPEHASGSPVFASADLYQAGGVLYFALTGRAPFKRESAESLMRAHVGEEVTPPSAHRPDIPADVDRLVQRALGKRPDERFASAQAMRWAVHEVRRAIAENEVSTDRLVPVPLPNRGSWHAPDTGGALADGRAGSRPSRRGERFFLIAVVVVLIMALSAAGIVAMIGESGAPRVAATSSAPPEPSAAPPEPPPEVSTPRMVVVPGLVGRSLAEARTLLDAAGLAVGEITTTNGPAPADTVLGLAETVGVRMAVGTPIALTVASGWNAVPNLIGLTEADAGLALRVAGFSAVAWHSGPGGLASQTTPLVLSAQPVAGTVERLGASVTVTVGFPVTEPDPTPVPDEPETPEEPVDPNGPSDPASLTTIVYPPVSRASIFSPNAFTGRTYSLQGRLPLAA